MDTNPLKDRTLGDQVTAFLRTELFYVLVLALVVLAGAVRTYRTFENPDAAGPVMGTIDQRDVYGPHYQLVKYQQQRHPQRAQFYTLVRMLDFAFFIGGVAAVLAFIFRAAYRRPDPLTPPVRLTCDPPWGLWDVLKLAGLFAGGAMVFHAIFQTDPQRPFMEPGDWMAEAFTRVLLIGALLHIALIERPGRLPDLGIRRGIGHPVFLGALAFLVVQPFLTLILTIETHLSWIEHLPLQTPMQALLTTSSNLVLVQGIVVAVLLGPLSEELLFRSFLQPVLQKWMGPTFGIILSAAFFSVAHMDVYVLPVIFILGLALGYVYHRSRSLLAPLTLHVLFNAHGTLMLLAVRALNDMRA